jgi:hypothetical protein
LEKTECTLNPTARFPSVYIAGNTFSKSALKKYKAGTHYPSGTKTVVRSKEWKKSHVKTILIGGNYGV